MLTPFTSPAHPFEDLADLLAFAENEYAEAHEERFLERVTLTAAVVADAFRRFDARAVLVGDSALEFHAPGSRWMREVEFVVDGLFAPIPAERCDALFTSLGFASLSPNRWVRRGLVVHAVRGVPPNLPTITIVVGSKSIEVATLEILFAVRAERFMETGDVVHAAQIILLMRSVGQELDLDQLQRLAEERGVARIMAALRALAVSTTYITYQTLIDVREANLHPHAMAVPLFPPLSRKIFQ